MEVTIDSQIKKLYYKYLENKMKKINEEIEEKKALPSLEATERKTLPNLEATSKKNFEIGLNSKKIKQLASE